MNKTNTLAYDLDCILDHTCDLWDEMRGQRIFITGGTGFFGCWLLESFIWANDRLNLHASATVLSRNPQSFQRQMPHLAFNPAVHLHIGDVRSFIFPEGQFSHIIHAATEGDILLMMKDPLTIFDINVQGTRRVLEFSRICTASNILFTSSGAIYGKQPSGMPFLSEDAYVASDPTDIDSIYGATGEEKRIAETLCALYASQYRLKPKIARCFSFIGPYLPLNGKFAVGNFIRDGLAGGPIRIKGDGTTYRSYLYAADLATWLWTILFIGKPCYPYNVGSENPVTIAELAMQVASCFQPAPIIEILSDHQAGKLPERYVPSVQRCVSELGLRQTIELRESILRTIGWHQV